MTTTSSNSVPQRGASSFLGELVRAALPPGPAFGLWACGLMVCGLLACGLLACGASDERALGIEPQPSSSLASPQPPTVASVSASASASASSAPSVSISAAGAPLAPLDAASITIDGIQLGDLYASTVMARDPYKEPCDNDPVDNRHRRFMVYGAKPCRGLMFPRQTTVIFLLAFADGTHPYEQPIEAMAWLGGDYFDAHSPLPVRIGDFAHEADAALGEAKTTLRIDRKGSILLARLHQGNIWSVLEANAVVGLVLGKMPLDAENEQWRAIAQMYFRYTKPLK